MFKIEKIKYSTFGFYAMIVDANGNATEVQFASPNEAEKYVAALNTYA